MFGQPHVDGYREGYATEDDCQYQQCCIHYVSYVKRLRINRRSDLPPIVVPKIMRH